MMLRRLRAWAVRLGGLFNKERRDRELAEELETHLQMHIEDNLRSGMTPEEARRDAYIKLGSVEATKEKVRDRRGVPVIENLIRDLRYALRTLRRSPGFTAVAVLSLSLGIGANTALFSVVDAVLLKKLPVKEPDRLVLFKSVAGPTFSPGSHRGSATRDEAGRLARSSFPYLTYARLRAQPGVLSDVFACGDMNVNVSAGGRAEVASGQAVSGNYYAALGVPALVGRTLTDEDDRAAATPAAVLSHRYWQRRFGGDPAIVGRHINLNSVAFTVVGVTPQGFDGAMELGTSPDVSIPIAWEPQVSGDRSMMKGSGAWWLRLMGRLKPGATAAQAQSSLEPIFQQSALEHREARRARENPTFKPLSPEEYPRLAVYPGSRGETNTRESYQRPLYMLLGVVALVLLIACANVANLLLARAAARQREIAVRLALGASRGRLVRQLLTESVLLAGLGGALGVLFAFWLKDGLLAVSAWGGGDMVALEPRLDLRVLGFTLALSLLTGVLFGMVPAWRATRVDLTPALKDSARSSTTARSWLTKSLVVAQVALSLLLMVGAGLFLRTLVNLQRVELGFDARNLLLFTVEPRLIGYKDERLANLYQQMFQRIEAVPGVQSVTFSREPLLAGGESDRSLFLPGGAAAADGELKPEGDVYIHQVRENFLGAMGIPLIAGRSLAPQDDARAPKVAVVNQAFVRRFLHGENAIGRRFGFDPENTGELEIVGLAGDAKYVRQREEIPPTVYLPWSQELSSAGVMTFEVRTSGDPVSYVAAIRQAASEVDANLPLKDIKTQVEQADERLAMERLFAKLLGLFGLLAQALAAVGLYGVLAWSVAQRTREIGIRVALGAGRGDVMRMVLRQGMTLTLVGVAVGLGGAYALTKYLASLTHMLYGVAPNDPLTYGLTAAALALVALLACYVPARRATKVDPMVALRYE
ncbi:MAG TPA: ABC transporter permease [Pyrinomonadaceae bacterium]|nr:ABC transporter permease [Pyrinomonadaceae bacterium]